MKTEDNDVPDELRALCTPKNRQLLDKVANYFERTARDVVMDVIGKRELHARGLMEDFQNLVFGVQQLADHTPLSPEQVLVFRHPVALLKTVDEAARRLGKNYTGEDKRDLDVNVRKPLQAVIAQFLQLDRGTTETWAKAAQEKSIGEWAEKATAIPFAGSGRDGVRATVQHIVQSLAEQGLLNCPEKEAQAVAEEATERCRGSGGYERRL